MDDYSTKDRSITTDNIFDIDRLGISDSYEGGKSISIGIDFKKEDIDDSDKYLEFKLATSLRDKINNNIPSSTTLNNKTSNIFGSLESSFSEYLTINYDFSLDNNLKSVDYNSIGAKVSVNNFITEFNFIEKIMNW